MGRELFYLLSKRLEPCCTEEEIVKEWNRIWDEVVLFHRTYIDNDKPVVPVESHMEYERRSGVYV